MKISITFFLLFICYSMSSAQTMEKLICFEEGQSVLGEEAHFTVSEVCQFIQENPQTFLKVIGYATQKGSTESNLTLSEERAMNVYNEILSNCSIDEENTYVTWLGESNQTYELHYDDAHSNMPCVDILINR